MILKEEIEDRIVNNLVRARGADFNSNLHEVRACETGTRLEILQDIKDWVVNTDEGQPRVLWLNGMAGVGKSTIAYSISEWARANGHLGASFFFSRDVQDLRKASLVFPTLSYQLAHFDHDFKQALADVLKGPDADAAYMRLPEQFDKLVHGPLNASNQNSMDLDKTFLIVLDAVDECNSELDVKILLRTLLQEIKKSSRRLFVFLTGRPEVPIREVFKGKGSGEYRTIILHDVEESTIRNDIKIYLTQGFSNPPDFISEINLPQDWFRAEDIDLLVEDCGQLFIYAATVLRFVFDKHVCNPRKQLRALLSDRDKPSPGSHTALDKLYLEILVGTLSSEENDDRENEAKLTRTIIEAIVFLRNPLPSRYFFEFIGADEIDIRARLRRLHSIILVPEPADEWKLSPLFLHKSFPEFIVDAERCRDKKFVVCPEDGETDMCLRCIDAMMHHLSGEAMDLDVLKRLDVARNVGSPTNEQQGMFTQPFPPHLRYSCMFWSTHLALSRKGDRSVVEKLKEFANGYLLYWLEAMSYLGSVDGAERCMTDALKWTVREPALVLSLPF